MAVASQIEEETRFVELVFPVHANHYGTLFAGNILQLMSKAAFVSATRRARCAVVMASSDKVEFLSPVPVGELVECTTRIERLGRASITVAVDMTAEALVSGERRLAARGTFKMVTVDAGGKPILLPDHLQSDSRQEP